MISVNDEYKGQHSLARSLNRNQMESNLKLTNLIILNDNDDSIISFF
jgi:hypothetical protein